MIDSAIATWTSRHALQDALAALAHAGVPAGKVFTVKDIVEDEHYRARDMLRRVQLKDGSSLLVPGIVPKLSATPGRIEGGGPDLGEHTESVLQQLGLDGPQIEGLRATGLIR